MKWLREHPTIILGVLASVGLIVNQAVTGEVRWSAAVPMVVAIVIHSLVTPAAPGWVAKHGILLGLAASLAIVVGQLADGDLTPIAALPVVLGLVAQAYNPPDGAPEGLQGGYARLEVLLVVGSAALVLAA